MKRVRSTVLVAAFLHRLLRPRSIKRGDEKISVCFVISPERHYWIVKRRISIFTFIELILSFLSPTSMNAPGTDRCAHFSPLSRVCARDQVGPETLVIPEHVRLFLSAFWTYLLSQIESRRPKEQVGEATRLLLRRFYDSRSDANASLTLSI